MTGQEIEKGNCLIAQFLECEARILSNLGLHQYKLAGSSKSWTSVEDLKYHSSLDWILPAIEKIENLSVKGEEELSEDQTEEVDYTFTVNINGKQCMIDRHMAPQFYGTEDDFLNLYNCNNIDKKESIFSAVVKFIKWYNIQKKLSPFGIK